MAAAHWAGEPDPRGLTSCTTAEAHVELHDHYAKEMPVIGKGRRLTGGLA